MRGMIDDMSDRYPASEHLSNKPSTTSLITNIQNLPWRLNNNTVKAHTSLNFRFTEIITKRPTWQGLSK